MAIMAMAVVSCDKKGIEDIEIATPTPEDEIQQTIEELGDYDVGLVAEMLANKKWKQWSIVRYDDDWDKIVSMYLYKGVNEYCEGNIHWDFVFTKDGECVSNVGSVGYRAKYYGTWSFNPETRVISINYSHFDVEATNNPTFEDTPYISMDWEYKLIALSEDRFLLDYANSYNKRYEYIVEK